MICSLHFLQSLSQSTTSPEVFHTSQHLKPVLSTGPFILQQTNILPHRSIKNPISESVVIIKHAILIRTSLESKTGNSPIMIIITSPYRPTILPRTRRVPATEPTRRQSVERVARSVGKRVDHRVSGVRCEIEIGRSDHVGVVGGFEGVAAAGHGHYSLFVEVEGYARTGLRRGSVVSVLDCGCAVVMDEEVVGFG